MIPIRPCWRSIRLLTVLGVATAGLGALCFYEGCRSYQEARGNRKVIATWPSELATIVRRDREGWTDGRRTGEFFRVFYRYSGNRSEKMPTNTTLPISASFRDDGKLLVYVDPDDTNRSIPALRLTQAKTLWGYFILAIPFAIAALLTARQFIRIERDPDQSFTDVSLFDDGDSSRE